MVKVMVTCFLLVCIILPTVAVAQDEYETYEFDGQYVVKYGLFGCLYKGFVGTCRLFEMIIFGKYGVQGISEYMRADKVFQARHPQY